MGGSGLGDVFDVLRSRTAVLAALSEETKSPTELTTELSLSRSTIDRAIHELEDVGFVDTTDGTVRVTLFGRLAIETYATFVENLDSIGAVGDLFESLPLDAPFDPVMVEGSSAVVADGPDDTRPLDRMVSFTDDAISIRGCVVEASEALVEAYYRRLLDDDDVSVHLVATEDVVQRLITTYRSQLVELLGDESFSLRSTDSLPYTLLVVELPRGPVVVLGVYDEGRLVGVVHNDDPRAVEWARSQFDHCRDDSDSIPLSPSVEE
ncbi:helix-turn-helix transcriptional regulator [Haloferax sp. YSSS75]|uniref:helix-turn-helix transcriptional regulator n=1 Tax=Haloferax sp. YSSS75 TaxID=3388564 RepID=UPI00398D2509